MTEQECEWCGRLLEPDEDGNWWDKDGICSECWCSPECTHDGTGYCETCKDRYPAEKIWRDNDTNELLCNLHLMRRVKTMIRDTGYTGVFFRRLCECL